MEYPKGNLIYKLALYGDSLANPRQGIVKSEERYISLIEKYIRETDKFSYLEIRDKAKGGATLTELYNQYIEDNTYYELPGNTLIIHAGIVDCAPRPVNDNNRNKIAKLPNFIKKIIVNYIHKNRASILSKNGGYVKTELFKFKDLMNNFINHGIENYNRVFIINICPTNKEIEARSPGFSNNIDKYNQAITDLVENAKSKKINLINF